MANLATEYLTRRPKKYIDIWIEKQTDTDRSC